MQNKSPLLIGLVLAAIAALVLLSRGSSLSRVPQMEAPETHNISSVEMTEKYGKLPLYFVENQGRLNPTVKYYVPGRDKNVYFSPGGVVYELFAAPGRSDTRRAQPVSHSAGQVDRAGQADSARQAGPRAYRDRWAVQLGFVGANPDPRVVGDDRATAR